MGCSASLGNPGFFNRKQFDCNVFHETTTTLKFTENSDTTSPSENPKTSEENNNRAVVDSTVTLPNKLNNSNIVSDSKNDGLQVNQAHILIISRESSISSACSSNFNSTNIKRARSGSLAPGGRTWISKRHSIAGTENVQENRVIKSVLKTGPSPVEGHLLVNRPIKSVTFLDAVTVVTVY